MKIAFDINRFKENNVETYLVHENVTFKVLSIDERQTFFGPYYSFVLKPLNFHSQFKTTYKPLDKLNLYMIVEEEKPDQNPKLQINEDIYFVLNGDKKIVDVGIIAVTHLDNIFVSTVNGKTVSVSHIEDNMTIVSKTVFEKYPIGMTFIRDGKFYKIDDYLLGMPFSNKRLDIETMTLETKGYRLGNI